MRRIDTEADIAEGLAALVRLDPRLEAVVARSGVVPLRRVPHGLSALVSIVVSQQISRASADAILGRFATLVDIDDAAMLRAAGEEAFRKAGLSRPKQATLLALARAVIEDGLDLDGLAAAPADQARAALTAIPGIGPWTAEVYLLAAAGHPDIFPAGDVALQGAVGHALGIDPRPTAKALAIMAESWAPWRSVAARLFWAYWRTMRGSEAAPALQAEKNR